MSVLPMLLPATQLISMSLGFNACCRHTSAQSY